MTRFIDSILNFVFSQHHLWAGIKAFFGGIWSFVFDHQMLLLLVIILFCIGLLFLTRLKRRYLNIRKLWSFILFFLTKRQMFIPLIYTLAKRQPGFDSPKLEQLLSIREHCRAKSLKHAPHQRLALEKKVSQTLYEYFSFLEDQHKMQMQSKFGHVVRDLEFIDSKLVELQKLYNLEAKKWNNLGGKIYTSLLFRILGMRPFDLFSD